MRKKKQPKACAFGGDENHHPWAVADQAVIKAVRCVSNRTRPVSWLGPKSFGTHLRTKGTRCFAGGHRHRAPPTPKGSPGGSCTRRRETLPGRAKTNDQQAACRGRAIGRLRSLRDTRDGEAHAIAEGEDMLGTPCGRQGEAPLRKTSASGPDECVAANKPSPRETGFRQAHASAGAWNSCCGHHQATG